MMPTHIAAFDREHDAALRKLWFCGDIHGDMRHIMRSLARTNKVDLPTHVIFLGDQDLERPFDDYLLPMSREWPSVSYAYIMGNHDCDSWDKYEFLMSSTLALNLDGKVTKINGIRNAGLGGVFLEKVWYPPVAPRLASASAALMRGAFQYRGSQRPSPQYLSAIYSETLDQLSMKQADILITHEAPACHPHGFEILSDVARAMGCVRSFHGHHHDDLTESLYRPSIDVRGYDAIAVNYCAIKNGLGEVIFEGPGNA